MHLLWSREDNRCRSGLAEEVAEYNSSYNVEDIVFSHHVWAHVKPVKHLNSMLWVKDILLMLWRSRFNIGTKV